MLHLSQGQLTLLDTCPRKFQHIYLEQLGFPMAPEQQERLSWGDRFHRLMQQRELGLAVKNLLPVDAAIQRSVEAFVQAVPEVFQANSTTVRQSEHRRTIHMQGYLLTAVYDLLVLSDQQAEILDWKTYRRPQDARQLAQHWQTRLYPFVLAETSHYAPEQISMTYWFVPTGQDLFSQTASLQPASLQPESLKFIYSAALHQQTRQALLDRFTELTTWLEHYEMGERFPQVASIAPCDTCTFALRCQRGQSTMSVSNWAEIEEVAL